MPSTARGIPYPSGSDAPLGPAQMQALSTAVDGLFTTAEATMDSKIAAALAKIKGGRIAYAINPAASFALVVITFPVPFAAGMVPACTFTVEEANNLLVQTRVQSVSRTGFTAVVQYAANNITSGIVHWHATTAPF